MALNDLKVYLDLRWDKDCDTGAIKKYKWYS